MIWSRPSVNYWPDNACAKAFWSQQELPPYRELLADSVARLDVQPGHRWLDLGCGRGMLTRGMWEKSGGQVAEIIGMDIAAANVHAYDKLQRTLNPRPQPRQVRFIAADFNSGLAQFVDNTFDGIVSGLAISYADSYCEETGSWTMSAYDQVLRDARRVLKPRGQFVFSVNIPEPSWAKVAWQSVRGAFRTWKPHRYALKALRIYRYGRWLKREARRGRFHYLPIEVIGDKLRASGFSDIQSTLSFSGQAYVVSCRAGRVALAAAA